MSLPDSLINELDVTMARMARVMASRHGHGVDCHGLMSAGQALALHSLAHGGDVKVSDIAGLLAIRPPAATALVDALETQGFVERVAAENDRRVTFVRPTDAGRDALERAESQRREAMRHYLEVLSEEDIRSLIRILSTLLEAMDEGRV